jgi:hypothetical protein
MSSLVDAVENCLPIFVEPMFCLASSSCTYPAILPFALESFDARGAGLVQARHPAQLHPGPL